MNHERALDLASVFGREQAGRQRKSQPLEETVVELYRALRPSLLGYVYQVVGTTGEAEDIVQTAFLRTFDQLQKGAPIGNLRGWVYRVAHNLAIDYLRRNDRQEAATVEWLTERAKIASSGSAEKDVIARERIARSLARLNPRERYCLMLRAEGLSYQEIGDTLSISAKAVSVYLSRGLKKFGKLEGKK